MSRPQPDRNHSFDVRDNADFHTYPPAAYQPGPQRLPYSPPPGYSYEPPSHRRPVEQTNPFDDPSYESRSQYSSYSRDGLPAALRPGSDTTTGMDNLGPSSAGGGISGIAMGVAGQHERESGLQAARGMSPGARGQDYYDRPDERYRPIGSDTPYIPEHPARPPLSQGANSTSSSLPLAAAAVGPAWSAPRGHPDHGQGVPLDDYPSPGGYDHAHAQAYYADSPYKRYSSPWDPRFDQDYFDPNDIADDGDDGIPQSRATKRRSLIGLGRQPVGAAAGAAAAGGALGALGGVVGSRDASGNYNPVAGGDGTAGNGAEKSAILAKEAASRKRRKLTFVILGVILVIAIIVGATVGGILATRRNSSSGGKKGGSGGGDTAAQDDGNGDLDADSDEIKQLLNNPDLHRVFPGIDYTPYNAQYPDCLSNPPSQNNITRDVAVLSQLTKTIKLYGTDCNQTDMVLHSIKQLRLNDMKVWPAVWLDKNTTTNDRQMRDMASILKRFGADPFAGVVVGNEVLYREDMTRAELIDNVQQIRHNMSKLNIDLPIAIADLGDNWKADMVDEVDVIMSNIHPFFAGTKADQAAGWTWSFWDSHDVVLTSGNATKKQIVSEVGWPSDGGNNCGSAKCTSKTQGSIAGIDEMNLFMEDYVCQSLKNGTDFFWFEAFDEPWKVRFNKGDEQWEDKWGLMYISRDLKPGVKIPDCGGQTV